jgi:hypothetical protein
MQSEEAKQNGKPNKKGTLRAVCFRRISLDLNMTAAIQRVIEKPEF